MQFVYTCDKISTGQAKKGDLNMTKTLWCEVEERTNQLERGKMVKVTATKVDEIEARVKNLYRDEEGNEYIVFYNKFLRRNEFSRL